MTVDNKMEKLRSCRTRLHFDEYEKSPASYSHWEYQYECGSDVWQEGAALVRQFNQLVISGRDPNLFSTAQDVAEFDLELNELEYLRWAMARMQAEYACVEAAARAFDDVLPSPPSHVMTSRCTSQSVQTPSPDLPYYNYTRQNAAATIEWLHTHYTEQPGISLPRGAMFGHYLDHCRQVALDPVNQASFGKIIRSIFPEVKTRRLGTRGQSKYHYYGLAIKETSPYKEIMMSAQRVNNFFGEPTGKGMYSRTVAQTSLPRTPPGGGSEALQGSVLLQDFPSASSIHFRDAIKDTVTVFLMMYRHHCQRIIDTILRANLPDVKEFVVHFWQSLPNHIHTVLRDDTVVAAVTLCDQVLYDAVTALLIPSPTHPLPTNLMTAIRSFGRDLVMWLSEALKSHPTDLRKSKLQAARVLSERLWRLTAVSHMASVARNFLHSRDVTTKLPSDWDTLDVDIINKEVSCDLGFSAMERDDLQQYVEDFTQLLHQNITLDQFINWVKVVFSQTIRTRVESSTDGSLQVAARVILLQWVYIAKVFIRELTLLSADMFGPYHLLSLLSQDYILYLTEDWKREEANLYLKHSVYGGEEKKFTPDWDKLLQVLPYLEQVSSNFSSPDMYQQTPDRAYPSQRLSYSYQTLPASLRSPSTPVGQNIKREASYASMLGTQKMEHCGFLECQDDMMNQDRAFDQVEQTPPDDVGGHPRALDLSLNYNSSFTDDDALVDKVISKGYATLDDCSPLPWKSEPNHLQTTPSPLMHRHESIQNSRTMTQATSTITSPVTYHQLHSHAPTSMPQNNMVPDSSRINLQKSEHFGTSINNQNYNNSNNIQQSQSPSPAFMPRPNFYQSESQYNRNSHHHHHQQQQQNQRRQQQTPSPLQSPGLLPLKASIPLPPKHSQQYSMASSGSPHSFSLTREEQTPSPLPLQLSIPLPLPKHTQQYSVASSRSPHSLSLPEFTHISGSLQVAPVKPRKRWIMEEEMRNSQLPARHISPT